MSKATFKGQHLIRVGLQFHHVGKHGSIQASMMLEKELGVLQLQKETVWHIGHHLSMEDFKTSPIETHFH